MSAKVARPTDIHIKQLPEENPYELSPAGYDLDEIEMRNHTKFSALPQDPPPAPLPRQRVAETDVSNGVSTDQSGSPVYKNPPGYRGRSQHGGHHFYEEVNHSGRGLQNQTSKDSEYGSPASLARSQTEADQAMFSQSTTSSLAPLTLDTIERKPRKKVNPLYDSYREDNGTAETPDRKTESSLSVDKESLKSSGPAGCVGSVLRHPCTTLFLFLLLVGLVVLFVLLLLGTISSKGLTAGQTDAQKQPANTSTSAEVERLRSLVDEQQAVMNQMMAQIQVLEMAISTPGGENATTELKVAQNTLKIMELETSLERIDAISTKANLAYDQSSRNINTLGSLTGRVNTLEDKTKTLNTSVNTLTGNLQTHSIDIISIKGVNQAQDNQITVLDSQISVVRQEFAMALSDYNDTIFQELDAVSKMQGPRGFNGSDGASGAGDLSRCMYQQANTGSGTGTAETTTSQISAGPNEVLTGVTCSTAGGERALLAVTNDKFYCKCSGTFAAVDGLRYCYIHYWRCPTT